jgi:hypothetical protein
MAGMLCQEGMAPKYFDSSPYPLPSEGKLGALYRALSASRFAQLPPGLSREEARALDRYLLARLDLEREERRMHFGALALAAALFFLLLPPVLAGEFRDLLLDSMALLLFLLLPPYLFVYFNYENRVRAMSEAHLRLLESDLSFEESA